MRNEILLRPVLALLLPLAIFVVLYFVCRKENTAIDVYERYRLAVCAAFTFLLWVLVSSSPVRGAAKVLADLSGTTSVTCAWGLAVTAWRLGVKKPAAAIVLTVLTTVSLGAWGLIWAGRF